MDIQQFYEWKFIKSHINFFDKNILYKLFWFFYLNAKRQKLLYLFLKNFKDKKNIKILDFWCWWWNELLKDFNTTWIDLSSLSLKNAAKLYKKTILILPNCPLEIESNTLDLIVSIDVIWHLSKEEKKLYFDEFSRVLKKDWKIFIMAEMDCNLHLFKFAKKYNNLYKKYFINEDWHFWLETFDWYKKIFNNYWFKIIKFEKNVWDIFWPIDEYLKRFNNEYKTKSFSLKIFIPILQLIKKIKLKYFFDFFISILNFINNFFSNEKNSTSWFFILSKNK